MMIAQHVRSGFLRELAAHAEGDFGEGFFHTRNKLLEGSFFAVGNSAVVFSQSHSGIRG